MNLGAVVRAAGVAYGERAAFVRPDGSPVAYRSLAERVERATRGLAAAGVGEGAVVGLVLPSDVEYVVGYAAASALGAVTAGVSPRLAGPEKDAVLDRLAADFVFGPGDVDVLARGGGPAVSPVTPDPGRLAAVVFTSGTTGDPKGAVFTEGHVGAVDSLDAGAIPTGGGGPMLASTQFAHVGFMLKLPWYLRVGVTLCLMERWRASDALRLIEAHRMTSVGGIGAQIALMLREPEFDERDLSSVKTIVVGGGPSPAPLVEEARRRFGAAYSIRYSSTESGGVGTGTAFDAPDEEALHTVGRPRAGVEVRVDEVTGEVLLRSPAVMRGYWRDQDATRAALDADGWLRTGDLGVIDGDGCLRLTGRASDMFIRGGYNVHPAEVETVLLDHPDVDAVAVVPRPDPVMGEIGVAVVVPRDRAAAPALDDLRAFAAPRLASYKLPEALVIVEALPLTANEKVDRRALKLRYA